MQSTSKALFVSGVAAYGDSRVVCRYFSRYGQIASVEELNLGKQRKAFKVTTDLATYKRILSQKDHLIDGRNIQCNPFIVGEDLVKKNIKMNKCRVIIKKVPASVSQSYLRSIIESAAGEIRTMFEFKPDCRVQAVPGQKSSRRYCSYSVLFSTQASAARLANGPLFLEPFNTYVIIERFKYRQTRDQPLVDYTHTHSLLVSGTKTSLAQTSQTGIGISDPEKTRVLLPEARLLKKGRYINGLTGINHQESNIRFNRTVLPLV